MKYRIVAVTVLFAAISFSACAGTEADDMKGVAAPQSSPSDAGLYLAAFGGADFAQDNGNGRMDFNEGPLSASFRLSNNNGQVGGAGGIKVGYNFESFSIGGNFRLQPAVEAEAFYLGSTTKLSTSYLGGAIGLQGDMNDAAFMVNGLLRLKTGTIFTPYIGAGIGAEYMSFSRVSTDILGTNYPLQNADDVDLALQAIAGFDINLTKHWSLFTEYKFVAALNPSFGLGNGYFGLPAEYDPNYIGQNIISAGVKYQF